MVKCNLRFLILSLGIFGNILNVKSQQTGDCGIFQNAIIDLGEENLQKYAINDCCNHNDITCENNSITRIKISNIRCNDIRFESIISKLANLQHLTTFEISYTRDCTRSMPNNLSELKNLKSLILNDNGFDDSLPENISKISSLEKLDMSNNRFFGTIPACYSDLKNLKTLKLNGNRLTGAVPYNFSQLENLTELNLAYNNDLNGYIPKMSKVKICDYDKTGICSLSSTTCKKDLPLCSKDDVRKSNAENGSPDPEAYEGDVQSIKLWFKENSWKIPFIILLTIFGISISFICCGLGSMCCSCGSSSSGDYDGTKSSTTTGKSTLPTYIQLPPPTQKKKSGFKWDGNGRPTYFNKSGHAVYTFKKNKY